MKDQRAVSLPIYSEKQYFPKWLLLIIAVAGLLPFIIVSAVHIFPFSVITALLIPILLIFALFLSCNLRTEVFSDGIRYRFFPFHLHWHFIPNNEIEKIYVRKYSPLRDYGGWGIRWSRESKAYNTSGNMGMQLELKNGKKILFGTQKPENWEKIIKEMFAD